MTEDTALSQVEEIPHEATEILLARVRGMPGRRNLRACLFLGTMTVAFIAAMVGLGSAGYLNTAWPVFAALALTWGPGIWLWVLAERRERRTIEALAACREMSAVSGLLSCVNCSNRRVRNMVHHALLDLLPRVTEDHSASLDTGQREVLNALLYGKSGEMAMAALSALEQVGDGTALPYLTSIAAGKGVPGMLRDRKAEVQARAQRTVESIRERIERQNRASVLLRAAHAPGTPSGQLVRPVHSLPLVNGQELLRPEMSGEQDAGQKEDIL